MRLLLQDLLQEQLLLRHQANSVCVNGTLQLTSNGSGVGTLTYTWSSSNPAVATVDNTGLVTGVTAGSTNITYTVIDGNGCSRTSPAYTITVNDIPTGNIAITEISGNTPDDGIICAGEAIKLTAPPGNGAYTFYVVGIDDTLQRGPLNAYSSSDLPVGSYQVAVIVANNSNCGATLGPVTITVNPITTPILSADKASICPGDMVTFTASPAPAAGYSYNFKVGGSSVQTGPSDIYGPVPYTGGSVTVDLTNENGCTAISAPVTVSINPAPSGTLAESDNSGTANDDKKVCAGDNVTFTATPIGTGTGYLYTFKVNGTPVVGSPSTVNTYNTSFATAGSYVVTVDVTNGSGCTASFGPSQTVTIFALPTGSVTITETSGIPNDSTICKGSNVKFTATAVGTDYKFYLNGTGAPIQQGSANFINLTTLNNGNFITVLVTNGNTCTATFTSNKVNVINLPPGTLTALFCRYHNMCW